MNVLLLIVFTLGLPFCIFIGMLGFYEGVPVLRDIPFADRIPVMRELITGRVATESAKAAAVAREGFVSLAEKTALEAQLAKRATAAAAAKKVADEKLEETIREDAGVPGGGVWTGDDDQWVRNHRGKAN